MSAEPREREVVECKTPQGRLLATVEIAAPRTNETLPVEKHPLVAFPKEEALRNGEERLQLRERGRYEYKLTATSPIDDLVLQDGNGITRSQMSLPGEDRGLIEPQDHCGLLPLVVVRRGNDVPLAAGAVEVRSWKIGYREHYRGMLSFIAEKCSGLLLDSRAPTRLRLDTLWQKDSRVLEQQLEFLRHTVASPAFRSAVDEVIRNPHRHLEDEREERDIFRPFKHGKDFARQIATATDAWPFPLLIRYMQ